MVIQSQRGKVIGLRKRVFSTLILLISLLALYVTWQFWAIEDHVLSQADNLRIVVWMGVTWSMDIHTDEELQALAQNINAQGIDDVYVYVSYLRPDDTFNPTYDESQTFVARMREYVPHVRWFAWVGVPIEVDERGNRLEDSNIRDQIAEFATMSVIELGFDGIHLNAELIPNNDPAFLLTLNAIAERLPDTAFLSTTAHALRPLRPVTSVPYPHVAHHWSPEYLQAVAHITDQIALMAYDSALPFPRDYRAWVRYQVQESAAILGQVDVELLIGVPTSEEWTISHQTQAETLANAIHGLNAGWSSGIDGIAIYPYWETSDEEWRLIVP